MTVNEADVGLSSTVRDQFHCVKLIENSGDHVNTAPLITSEMTISVSFSGIYPLIVYGTILQAAGPATLSNSHVSVCCIHSFVKLQKV